MVDIEKSSKFLLIFLQFIIWSVYANDNNFIHQRLEGDQCNSADLEILGCSIEQIYSINSNDYLSCPSGSSLVNCKFSNNQSEDKNDLSNFLNNLQQLNVNKCCWSILNFENVYNIPTMAFENVTLIQTTQYGNRVYLAFENVYQISKSAFDMGEIEDFKITKNLAQNLIIEFNGAKNSVFDNKQLVINDFAFNSLQCQRLTFMNYLGLNVNNTYLNLKSSMFFNAAVDSLIIKNTNLNYGFDDTLVVWNDNPGEINTIVIDNCYLYKNTLTNLTVGNFVFLKNFILIDSSIKHVEENSFISYCYDNDGNEDDDDQNDESDYLVQLVLNNNILHHIHNYSFKCLTRLEYLSLENNPIRTIEPNSFDMFKSSLRKLNLKSVQITKLSSFMPYMGNLSELILSNNNQLTLNDLKFVFKQAKNLNYLDLSNTILTLNENILEALEAINNQIIQFGVTYEDTLKFIDISNVNYQLNAINDTQFKKHFENFGNVNYLNNLLKDTFIYLNPNHECNCAIIYLYKNLFNYKLPIIINNASVDYIDYRINYMHNYVNISSNYMYVMSFLPKCYRNLMFNYSNFNNIFEDNKHKCGFYPPVSTKSTRSTTEIISTTVVIDNNHITVKNSIVEIHYVLPFTAGIFVIMILAIFIIAIKHKQQYRKEFLKSCKNVSKKLENAQPTRRNANNSNIHIISSQVVAESSFADDNISERTSITDIVDIDESTWQTFRYYKGAKRSIRSSLSHIFKK